MFNYNTLNLVGNFTTFFAEYCTQLRPKNFLLLIATVTLNLLLATIHILRYLIRKTHCRVRPFNFKSRKITCALKYYLQMNHKSYQQNNQQNLCNYCTSLLHPTLIFVFLVEQNSTFPTWPNKIFDYLVSIY